MKNNQFKSVDIIIKGRGIEMEDKNAHLYAEALLEIEELKSQVKYLTKLLKTNEEIHAIQMAELEKELRGNSSDKKKIPTNQSLMKASTRINLSLPEVQNYLKAAITRINELRADKYTIDYAITRVEAEGLEEGTEFSEMMYNFLAARGFGRDSKVSKYNLKDYYMYRYEIVGGVVVKRVKKPKISWE